MDQLMSSAKHDCASIIRGARCSLLQVVTYSSVRYVHARELVDRRKHVHSKLVMKQIARLRTLDFR